MKKGLKLFSLLLGSSILLSGCDQFTSDWPNQLPSPEEMGIDTPWSDYSNPCSSITFGKGDANVNLNKGETHTYSYSVEPRDFDTSSLVWASDNPEVATIENGVLTAVGGGKANITLSCGEVAARSLVTVTVPITEFNVLNKEISLDIEGTSQINYEFAPEDTTQNAVQYSTESDIITVSDSGLITALGVAGDAEVKVTNEGLNKVEIVNVHVSDNWNYISTMTLSGPSKLEVTKSSNLTCNAVGVDPSREASALSNNSVVYSVKEGSEEFISVDPETGAITGLEPGTATLVAKLVDDRHPEALSEEALEEKTFTSEFAVEVFEVSIVSLDLTDSETIELDNAENISHQLSYTFTLSDPSFEEASRANIAYTSSDLEVATVSESGLVETVGPGTATITVKDLTSNVSDSIDVHTTIYAKSITLNSSGDFYLDESIEISANVVPAKTTDSVVWDYDEASGHTFVEQDNKLIVTCNNLDSSVDVKASVGGVTSNTLTLTPKEREVAFESGKTYIVGSSNFKTGVSKDVEGGSWNAAKYAFVMTDKTGNAHAKYEYKATIEFRENDEWKIRENVEDWRAISSSNGLYKVTEGAFAKGQMSVSGTPEEGNVLVNVAGKYDVYYAYYDDTETGWYEVYVEEHGMKLSSTDVHAKLTSPVTVSTISVDNYDGTVVLDEVDDEYISASFDALTSKISITPVKVGKTSFKVRDDYKEILVNVEIKEGSDAKPTTYYIRGDAANGWGIDESYVLRESADDNNYGEILDLYLKAGSFKIADENWSGGTVWGYEYDGHTTITGGAAANFTAGDSDNNIKCNVAGYYDIYLTKNNYISIENAGVEPVPFMWGIAGSGTGWKLDTDHPFVETTSEGDAIYTYKLNNFEFAKDATWKVTNTKDEWIANKLGVGFDLSKSTAGAFEIDKDGNIKVLTAGTYDITLNIWNFEYDGKDVVAGAQIYAVAHEAPAGPSISFGIANPEVAVNGTLEIPVTATNCSGLTYSITEGNEYITLDLLNSNDTKLIVNGTEYEGTSTVKAAASDGTEATIQIVCSESPTPVGDKDYIVKVCHDEVWSQLDMSQTVGDESQYEYTGDFDKDDIFVIHMYGETWYHFEDVKEGCLSLVSLQGSEDIKFNAAGNYTIYADYDADEKGDHIWIKKNVAPATMTIEGSDPVTMSVHEGVSGEFMLLDVSLETNEFFSFEYDGITVGYNDLKDDSPAGVTSNTAKHIAVTTAGSYDIYFDTAKIGSGCLYIAEHKAVTPDYVAHACVGGSWIDIPMEKDDEDQYVFTYDFSEGDSFKLHLTGDDWRGYDNLEDGCASLVSVDPLDKDKNILVTETARYTVYAKPTDGKNVWINKAPVPVTGDFSVTINGTSHDLTLNEKSGEYYLDNIDLSRDDLLEFYNGDQKLTVSAKVAPEGSANNCFLNSSNKIELIRALAAKEGEGIYFDPVNNTVWVNGNHESYSVVCNGEEYDLEAHGSGDGYKEFSFTLAEVSDGDQLVFNKNGLVVDAGPETGTGNNATADDYKGNTFCKVTKGGENLSVYFKVYADRYEVWVGEAKGDVVTVTFTINYGTESGQGVYIVGDFCGWDPTKGIRGTWTEGNNWVFTIEMPVDTVWSFKFVINSYDNPTDPAIRWEENPNRSYTFLADGSETFVWQA